MRKPFLGVIEKKKSVVEVIEVKVVCRLELGSYI